jgi:hypothetical protein
VVIPLKVKVGMPVTASEALVKVTLDDTLSTRLSDEPLSDPLPVQPLMVKASPPPLLVSVRLAVLIPLKDSDIGPAVSEVGERVKPDAFDAATVAVVPVSDPLPVQPLSVKVCPAPVTARLATVIRVKPSDMPSPDASDVLVNV